MPLSHSNRSDRRRRVMREAVAVDSEFAVESVRSLKRTRTKEANALDASETLSNGYRDPGYSHTVRRTCQQRIVQLIPVKRGSLTFAVGCMWLVWLGLVLSHYWIYTRGSATAPNSLRALPIGQLFHLRSSHSIAHWLTCQLWMLTAIASCLIFQLRRHKLDDYRAKYRIWVLLALAALFSSFDASSSSLFLLGSSLDSWARREIGYGGWPLVLATFASLIGILGLRLCNELKTAPASVGLWLSGLLAWAFSSLLGTGLIRSQMAPATLDLIVGAFWLGGILAVFQSAVIYLRHTYVQAQRRFLQRSGAYLGPLRFSMPRNPLSRRNEVDSTTDQPASEHDSERDPISLKSKRSWKLPWTRSIESEFDQNQSTSESRVSKQSRNELPDESSRKSKGRLFGVIPSREEMNADLDDEPIATDDRVSVDRGYTKTSGWFGLGGNKPATDDSTQPAPKQISAPSKTSLVVDQSTKENAKTEKQSTPRQAWFKRFQRKAKTAEPKSQTSTPEKPTTKSNATPQNKPNKSSRGFFGFFDGLRLKPPSELQAGASGKATQKPIAVSKTSNLPSTNSTAGNDDESSDDANGRPLSKAERRRLRRMQQDDRRVA